MTDHEVADALLHRLWSKAVGTPGYDKGEWIHMEGWVSKISVLGAENRDLKARLAQHHPKEETA